MEWSREYLLTSSLLNLSRQKSALWSTHRKRHMEAALFKAKLAKSTRLAPTYRVCFFVNFKSIKVKVCYGMAAPIPSSVSEFASPPKNQPDATAPFSEHQGRFLAKVDAGM